MFDHIPQELLQADDLIQEGKIQEAQKLLVVFIKQNPHSELGWYMLSHVTPQDSQKIECLKRVLAINPDNREARTDLARLTGKAPPHIIDPEFLKDSPFSTGLGNLPAPEASALPIADTRPAAWTALPINQDQPTPIPAAPPAYTWDSAPASLEPGSPPVGGAKTRQRSGHIQTILVILVTFLGCILVLGGVYIYLIYPAQLAAPAAAPTAPIGAVALAGETGTPAPEATFTEASTITLTPTVTPKPTSTPRPSETFIPPGPTLDLVMSAIQKQVSELRGLPVKVPVYSYIMTSDRVEELLKADFLAPDNQAGLQKRARVLTAFGLIKPTYDLIENAMNHVVERLGGFYTSTRNQIVILGLTFDGLERFIYSHEFDHALVDQNFNLEKLGVGDHCIYDSQRCEAINALVEGDAQLMMAQWLAAYATSKDYHELVAYVPPGEALPEQSPPPYTLRDLSFPFDYGMLFVKALYDKGQWPSVNRAYQNLPLSTAQIIHPAKYLAGIKPVPVAFPSFEAQMGTDWKLIDNNVLGEWDTYLILGYGADQAAQVSDKTAAAAAAGWSGDYYQVYYDENTSQSTVVVNWVWDSPESAKKFQRAMDTHLDVLFQGGSVKRSDGDCWELNNQATCLFTRNSQSLWIVTPSQDQLNTLKKQFTDFP